jgi:hypothetical protein
MNSTYLEVNAATLRVLAEAPDAKNTLQLATTLPLEMLVITTCSVPTWSNIKH